jgi:hypothetical protein
MKLPFVCWPPNVDFITARPSQYLFSICVLNILYQSRPEISKLWGAPPGALLVLLGGRVVCLRMIFIFNEIWTQGKYFGRHVAWMKYFTSQLVPVLAAHFVAG